MKNSSFLLSFSAFALLFAASACPKLTQDKAQKEETVYRIKVQTEQAKQHQFRRQIRVQGTIQAYITADLSARLAGNMQLLVTDGDHIKKGQPLFIIDQDNLKNRVAQAEQSLKVVEETKITTQLDLEIAKTQLDKAKLDFERAQRLQAVNAVSTSAFEDAQVALSKAQKTYDKAEAVLRYTEAKVDQAKLDLAIIRKDLDDATEKAPYDAIVAVKYHQSGEFMNKGTNIIHIDDPRHLRAACLISAVYFNAIQPGKTPVVVSFNGKQIPAKVDWCSPVIDTLSRTFTLRAYLPEDTPLLDGMLVDVDIILAESKGLGLPRNAVILKKGGKYAVYEVKEGKAREIEVQPGITFDGFTEILNPQAIEGRDIIVSGQYFVNDGSPVSITASK